ncbi:hypothetical protein K7X08_028033 [Anisodus acutangulus]|uniref:Uncharacterized protein n=1 Tax=Anisodus acutangulus TaxID=402998 RepID=A0A9Q1RQZ7_9SOLA|nr:hypothetical protein K7X08_028033 [Anisodus acutangulus]
MDWKTLGGAESSEPNVGSAVKKRLPKKIRQVLVQACYSKYGSTRRSKRMEESYGSLTNELFRLLSVLLQGVQFIRQMNIVTMAINFSLVSRSIL